MGLKLIGLRIMIMNSLVYSFVFCNFAYINKRIYFMKNFLMLMAGLALLFGVIVPGILFALSVIGYARIYSGY